MDFGFGFLGLGFGFWVLGFRFGFWVPGFGLWIWLLDFGFQVLGFGFWVLGVGYGVSGLGFWILSLWVLGTGADEKGATEMTNRVENPRDRTLIRTNILLLLKLADVPLLLRDVPLSTFVSVGSAL